ncbi:MAG: hypothetical protein DRZ82_00370 [Thermoprotei archaeon]|nr:MAG: hypothetical protein DRZ82_00370 [Thermoprotei archaeon]
MVRVITLLTDFGIRDPYVAQMKGVILSINPDTIIVDITHDIRPHDINEAAFILLSAYNKFPVGTIHVVVVDPGVGTRRKAIVIETKRYLFVGPDNGVLSLAADHDGITNVYEIKNEVFMRANVSYTFHGRDIFAPVAAYLSLGIDPKYVGPKLNPQRISRLAPVSAKKLGNMFLAHVLYIDHFGNVITNVRKDQIPQGITSVVIKHRGKQIKLPLKRTYGEVEKGEFVAVVGSFDYLEIAVNQGNAAKSLGMSVGDSLTIYFA